LFEELRYPILSIMHFYFSSTSLCW